MEHGLSNKFPIGGLRSFLRRIPFARTIWHLLLKVSGRARVRLIPVRPPSEVPEKLRDSSTLTVCGSDEMYISPGPSAELDMQRLEPYQVAALNELPHYSPPTVVDSINSLPGNLRIIVESLNPITGNQPALSASLSGRTLKKLNEDEFEEFLVKSAVERSIPVDIINGLLAVKNKMDSPADVLQFMHMYWRRLRYWEDVRDLTAMIMRRKFDWEEKTDQLAFEAGRIFRENGYANLPPIFSTKQAAEVHDYFLSRPGLRGHVPDGCKDQIRRYLGYGANEYPFCSYPLSDIVLAPHLLEALISPRIAELGFHSFGAIPRLWKIFTHWDLPGSKLIPEHGVSIGHYHRDLNDVGMMWVYVYLTDVDRRSGPHGVVPRSQSLEQVTNWFEDARDRGVDINQGTRNLTPDDFFDGYGYQIRLEVKEAMFADKEVVITGPAGTGFISNGFNFHRIVSPQYKPRLLCAARYYLSQPKQLESPYRDTDKIPFAIVKDRIGDSDFVREMTAGFVDWSHPRPLKGTAKKPASESRKYFLLISNGRTGSTWLSTSLGQLRGVCTDYEYRWSLPRGSEGNPAHYVIPNHQETVIESLDVFARNAMIVGSKLVFSLEWTQRQRVFEQRDLYFDSRITYVFLTRPYLDTLASFLLRGPVHDPVKSGSEADEAGVMLGQIRKSFENSVLDQRQFHGGEADVFRALRSLVNNDIIGFGLSQSYPNRLNISYENIATEFEKVARAIGWDGVSAEANAIISRPLVKKLPILDSSVFPQAGLFSEYSNQLSETLGIAIREQWGVEDLFKTQMRALEELRILLALPAMIA